jgi:ligand-binding sensor domain-containing protein/signal transduction histidine kinase
MNFSSQNFGKIFIARMRDSLSRISLAIRIIFLIIFFDLSIKAQVKNFVFEHVNMDAGLSQSTILAIAQDEKGFLWFGTQEGLNRFDGNEFEIYKSQPQNPNSLSDNWITCLLVDQEGDLWIGTSSGGLNLLDKKTFKFTVFRHDTTNPESISDDRILTLYEDKTGRIWVGTMNGGLNCLDKQNRNFERFNFAPLQKDLSGTCDVTTIAEDMGGNIWWGTNGDGLYCLNWDSSTVAHFRHRINDETSLSDNRISKILPDTNGKVWIGTLGGGLNLYDLKTGKFKIYVNNPNNNTSLSNDFIYDIYQDPSGMLWIATDDGLNQFIKSSKTFYAIKSDPTEPVSLSNNMIRAIYQDFGGILWIGTYSGALNKFDRKKAAFKNYFQNPAKKNSLSDKNVWAICEDNLGSVWVGTNNGLNRLNRKNDKFTHYFNAPNDPKSLSHNLVRAIYQDKRGDLWVGTEGGGLNRFDYTDERFERFEHNPSNPNSLSDNSLRHIYEDSEDNLWVGTINGLNKFDKSRKNTKRYYHDPNNKNSLSGNHVRYIYEDENKAIWIATFEGLSLYIKKFDNFISFKHNPSNFSSVANDRVLCLLEDSKGRFWIGTYGGGLDKLDREEFIFQHYSQEDGLPNNSIYGILEDTHGNLWMSTNYGISKFDPELNEFTNYDSNDGLQGNEFNGNAFLKNKFGEIFFGGINGLTVFNPENVVNNHNIPNIALTSVKIYDKELELEQSINETECIELSYKDNFISFEFAALDFTNPQKNSYAYMLEGFDKSWSLSSHRRFANYTNLNGGDYVFKVKGSNNNGLWNEKGLAIKLVIHPPIWQTWWFKFLLVLLILAMVYILITLRMKSINAQKRKLELEVAQRTRELNQSNYELLRAKRDTDDILNNVKEGIFLLNSNFEIGLQYSLSLEKLLHEQKLAGFNFLHLLQSKLDGEIVKSTEEYLNLLFKDDVDEESLKELNPLSEVELNIVDENNKWMNSKFLSFNFQRICEENKILNLIVTVIDITEKIVLARKLKISEEKTHNQMEWLVNILQIEPVLLNEFLDSAQRELNLVDSLLKHAGDDRKYHQILEEIYRSIHMIKGNATLLELKFFIELAHKFEEKISEIKRNSTVTGKDFIPLVLHLGEIKQSLTEIKNLIEKMGHFHHHLETKKRTDNDVLLKSIKNMVYNLSKEVKKEVEFNYNQFDIATLPYNYRLVVKDILIQLVRNALIHGIESPEERIQRNKKPLATISISSKMDGSNFILKFRDDGRGLQISKLKEFAFSSETIAYKDFDGWNAAQIANLIFEPGFTTLKNADLFAGRGIGLDLVKQKILDKNGSIEVEFEEGNYTEFIIRIPSKPERDSKNIRKSKKLIVENSIL